MMQPPEIRDAMIEFLREHKKECENPNCAEAYNIVAFLAHCAGINSASVGTLQEIMQRYEAACPGCAHLRN